MATLLDDLLSGFTVNRAQDWLRSVFSSYDSSVQLNVSLDRNSKNEPVYFQSVRSLGLVRHLPEMVGSNTNRPIAVIAVEMKENLTERTSRAIQFRLAKRLLEVCARQPIMGLTATITQGLFFFYTSDGSTYRFSLVSGEFTARALKLNDAKRQSFFINTEKANNVFRRRFATPIKSYQALQEAFSVESLTNEFYTRLFNWFCWATDEKTNVNYPNDLSTDKDNRASLSEAIIRLITRLMFVWFVRQKNLIPAELFDKEILPTTLKSFDGESMEEDNYYRCILQNLFFATLNCPLDKRKFQKIFKRYDEKRKKWYYVSNEQGVKTCYRYSKEFRNPEDFKALLSRVPFLNCALFECLDRLVDNKEQNNKKQLYLDGFSGDPTHRAHLPNGLFFKEEHLYPLRDADGKVREVPVCGLIHLFNLFDFTVDENLHNDADIVLDPELLSKVFENLLGAYDADTGVATRSATGSFYTPREIVDYMVETSLREYLKRQVPFVTDYHLDQLFDKDEDAKINFPYDVQMPILNALYDCKILDPACGSGAYPMGILQTMVRLLHRLDPNNIEQLKRIEKSYNESYAELEKDLNDKERAERQELLQQQYKEGRTFPDYARKLYLIENCIYGVDIQPIAVQISKLRFFISLLCDQLKQNYDSQEENYGFIALPNLETKFVCANTLLRLPPLKQDEEFVLATKEIEKLHLDLKRNRKKIYYARTIETKEKWRHEDKRLREAICNIISASGPKPDQQVIEKHEAYLKELKAKYERVKEPKWKEVIVQDDDLFGTTLSRSMQRVDINAEERKDLQEKIEKAEQKIKDENKKEQKQGNSPLDTIAKIVADWDPYDQNDSAKFFDPFWMFNIEKGFDIVIGNPPYFVIKNDNSLKGRYENEFPDLKSGRMNIYQLFFGIGENLLTRNGVLVYIHPKTLFGDAYLAATRKFLFERFSSTILINIVARRGVFASVLQSVAVSLWAKGELSEIRVANIISRSDFEQLKYIHLTKSQLVLDSGKFLVSSKQMTYEMMAKIQAQNTIRTNFRTGRIEWNKYKSYLSATPTNNSSRLIFGENVQRYAFVESKKRIASSYITDKSLPKIERLSILTQRTTAVEQPWRIIATLIDPFESQIGLVSENSVNTFEFDDKQDALYTLGVLTSRFMDVYFRLINSNTHVSSGELNSLPIPNVSIKRQIAVARLVECILEEKKRDTLADTHELEAEVNQMVYDLYNLTPEEIDFIEHYGEAPKQEASEPAKVKKPKAVKPQAPKAPVVAPDDDEEYMD